MAGLNRLWLVALLFAILLTGILWLVGFRPGAPLDVAGIALPSGFRITVFAEDLGGPSAVTAPGPAGGPRMLLYHDGAVYASLMQQGKVVRLQDTDEDGRADRVTDVIAGLNKPHGLDFHQGWFYVAEDDKVQRFRDDDRDGLADSGSLVKIMDLPGGGHFTRTLKIHGNRLYVSIGSSCNACREEDARRAAILVCRPDGYGCMNFAKGLRNAVGFIFVDGTLVATENGRDWLGDEAPPDELNLVQSGGDYGWPLCFGRNIHDSEFDPNTYVRDPCADKQPSWVDLPAHVAPLGLARYDGTAFPEEYRGDLFVALHGSWNRNDPVGYKVVRVDMASRQVTDFATGWFNGSAVSGRPVDVLNLPDGSLLVSDDHAGTIYRIRYVG